MSHINAITLSGVIIDNDPVTKTIASGAMTCSAWIHSVRISHYKDKQRTEEAKIEIEAWSKHAQTLAILRAGDEVLVTGRLKTREYQKDPSRPPMRFQALGVDELVVIKSRAKMDVSDLPPASDPSLSW